MLETQRHSQDLNRWIIHTNRSDIYYLQLWSSFIYMLCSHRYSWLQSSVPRYLKQATWDRNFWTASLPWIWLPRICGSWASARSIVCELGAWLASSKLEETSVTINPISANSCNRKSLHIPLVVWFCEIVEKLCRLHELAEILHIYPNTSSA